MAFVDKFIQGLGRYRLGFEGLTADLIATTDLIEEQTRLLRLFDECKVPDAPRAAEIEALERGYEGMDNGAYTLTSVRLFEGFQGIRNRFTR